jgi:Protein of unknown function, DUF488
METAQTTSVLTIGNSTHSRERFLALLRGADLSGLADVRTTSYSRYSPKFNRIGSETRCLGKQPGSRPRPPLLLRGIADNEKMAETEECTTGLERVIKGAKKFKIALMCAVQDPLDCHRCLLVSRALAERQRRRLRLIGARRK